MRKAVILLVVAITGAALGIFIAGSFIIGAPVQGCCGLFLLVALCVVAWAFLPHKEDA